MKYNKILAFVAAILIGTVSCTDTWDDHYSGNGAQNSAGTLWDAIEGNSEFSNFAYVLKSCYHTENNNGELIKHLPTYMTSLQSSQMFTVFAPTNDVFSKEEAQALVDKYFEEESKGVRESQNSVVKEFIENHIANYNYSVGTHTNELIKMMNGKYVSLTNNDFNGIEFGSLKSDVHSNGILYALRKKAPFYPNIYEYLGRDPELSGVYEFLQEYSVERFDTAHSVPGEIVDGQIQYLDSVTYMDNAMLGHLKATIDDEDSTLWFVAPTNDAWDNLVAKNEKYFVYPKGTEYRDSLMHVQPRRYALMGTVFSQTNNKDLESQTADSAMSTLAIPYFERKSTYGSLDKKYYQYDKPFAANGIFDVPENDLVQCSNGKTVKADEWRIKDSETFLRELVFEAESSEIFDSVDTKAAPPAYINVPMYNEAYYDKVHGNRYIQISPSGTVVQSANFKLKGNILSGVPYELYVVTAPAQAADTVKVEKPLPSRFNVEMKYTDVEGNTKTFAKVSGKGNANHVDEVYEVLIGTYTFPTCSYGLKEPKVSVNITNAVTALQNNKSATMVMRIDAIILRPKLDN